MFIDMPPIDIFTTQNKSLLAAVRQLDVEGLKKQALATIKSLFEQDSSIDPNEREPITERTALMYAAHHDVPEAVELLLAYGANYKLKDFEGKTAEEYAGPKTTHYFIEENWEKIKRELLEDNWEKLEEEHDE